MVDLAAPAPAERGVAGRARGDRKDHKIKAPTAGQVSRHTLFHVSAGKQSTNEGGTLFYVVYTERPEADGPAVTVIQIVGIGCHESYFDKMLVDGELCIRVLADSPGDRAAAHALNVTVISLLMGRVFGFRGIVYTPPTRTFSGELSVKVGDKEVRLVEVGPAHTQGDTLCCGPHCNHTSR